MNALLAASAIALSATTGLSLASPSLALPLMDGSSCSGSKAASAGEHPDIIATALADGHFKTLAAALTAADLVKPLQGKGPFTVFAPTDAAFEKLGSETISTLLLPKNKAKLASILTYHVVPGQLLAADVTTSTGATTLEGQRICFMGKDGKWFVDGAQITATDIKCSNGVIHVIDSVIMPSDKNIVQTAVDAKFTTLAMLLDKAGLVDALQGPGPFTVFAPTDAAFAKLDKATLDSLLKPENKDKLASILKYHVVPGRIFAEGAVKAASAKTLQGSPVAIKASGGKVMINASTVATADINATNGVIHVIDTVLMPKN